MFDKIWRAHEGVPETAGSRAVISDSIADTFFSNALKNGLVPVRIDVAASEVMLPDGRRAQFPLDPFARHSLVSGVDELPGARGCPTRAGSPGSGVPGSKLGDL